MEKKDGRRSRVPVGTFGASEPPPPPAAAPAPPAPSVEAGPPAPDAGDAHALDAAELRKRYVSTLVGHPASSSGPGSPAAPVLAPPKWRGAKAYLEGEEPQPHLSSIPTPPPVAVPAGSEVDVASAGRRRVTTKLGSPPPIMPPVAAAAAEPPPVELPPAEAPLAEAIGEPPPGPSAEAPRLAAISDAIQQMLDGQVSVPMQVEEPSADELDSIPIEELPMEELVDSEPPPAAAKPVPLARIVPRPAPPAPSIVETVEPRSAQRQRRASPAEVPGGGDAARAADAGERAPAAKPAATVGGSAAHREGAPVSSLAPAEVRGRRPADASQTGLGVVLVAAMFVIGVGGWFLTRGGYPGPPSRNLGPAPQPAATAAAAPAVPSPSSAAPPAAVAPSAAPVSTSEPSSSPAPARSLPTAPVEATAAEGHHAHHAHASAKPTAREPDNSHEPPPAAAEPTAREQSATLRVVPSPEHADLPDIPSREDVLAALAPIRAAVRACARDMHGTAQLDVTVANTGFVTYAVVGGDFAGTPEGSCIARAARGAQFVPFKKPRFRVIYPFSL